MVNDYAAENLGSSFQAQYISTKKTSTPFPTTLGDEVAAITLPTSQMETKVLGDYNSSQQEMMPSRASKGPDAFGDK